MALLFPALITYRGKEYVRMSDVSGNTVSVCRVIDGICKEMKRWPAAIDTLQDSRTD